MDNKNNSSNSSQRPRNDQNINIGMGGGRRGPGMHGMPVVKAKNFKGTLLKLWKYMGKERNMLFVVVLLVLSGTGLSLSFPYLIGKAIDTISPGINNVDFGILRITIFTLLAAYAIDEFIIFMQGWVMAGVSQRFIRNLRNIMFDKLQKLPIPFFDRFTHGEIMSRLANDMENISSTISQATVQLISVTITITGSLTMMLLLSPLLTLASLITLPLVVIMTRVVTKRTKILFKNQQVLLGRLNGHIEESISGLNVIKAYNHEEKVINDFEAINKNLFEVGVKAQIWSGFIMPLMNVINNIGFAAIAGFGGVLAVKGLLSIGTIAMFISYSRQFTRPLNEIANVYNILQSAVAGAERVFEILNEPEELQDSQAAMELKDVKGHVEFQNVDFGYRKDVPVLKNINFEVEAGKNVALVGSTGAGKTTIVNLLARFYDATNGRILIDGREIKEYTRDSLRNCFGIVLQDAYLFSGSIKENIRYGKLTATDSEIIEAARMANADVFINRLPHGYDSVIIENGGNLSQGQKQLIALARVILSDPSILILDEATSSVDTRTELNIQEAMLKVMNERTSFIIAHRLSTIRDADMIMVVESGEIVEKGNHSELLAYNGVYHNLYYSQLKKTEES